MRKNNRKGFTIVELVIVIAVIAILAAVLIPTFASVSQNAKKSAALQEARNLYTEYVAFKNGQVEDKLYVQGGDYYFVVEDGKMDDEALSSTPSEDSVIIVTENSVKETTDSEEKGA